LTSAVTQHADVDHAHNCCVLLLLLLPQGMASPVSLGEGRCLVS
jgi:hypothetical protein